VIYVGETLQRLNERFLNTYPKKYLEQFSPTHLFKIAQIKKSAVISLIQKAACYALEAITGILLENTLNFLIGIMGGHSINDAILGYRHFSCHDREGTPFVSFDRNTNQPLVVHTSYMNIEEEYGKCWSPVSTKQIIDAGNGGIVHGQCSNIILKAFYNNLQTRINE
jgi:hypothetical protein